MKNLFFFVLILTALSLKSQSGWDLQQCIKYALDHNIALKQSAITNEINKNNTRQSQAQTLPTLNMGAANTYNFGKTIDRFTNTFANTQVNYFDLQAGINYAYFPKEDVYINAGYSIHHVNKPKESFFSNPTTGNTIPIRHIGFANAMLKLNKSLILQPSIYYTNQAAASQVVLGLSTRINLISGGETQFISGVYYRNKEAIIPLLGFQIKSIQFNFSYDATISSLNAYNKSMGAGEISLIKKGFYPNTPYRQALCPSF
jgi:type IX secretion system PorP/SprF family membrane protein